MNYFVSVNPCRYVWVSLLTVSGILHAEPEALKKVESAFLGHHMSCAKMSDGDVKCWGRNYDRHLIGQVPYESGLGGSPGDMGDHLPALVNSKEIVNISSNWSTSCILFRPGNARCYGNGTEVMTKDVKSGASDALFDAGDGEAIKSIQASGSSICLLSQSGRVKCAGDLYDEYDLTVRNNIRTNPFIDFGTTKKVLQLELTGSNPQRYERTDDSRHFSSACALFEDFSVKCWGSNTNGQLGLGHTRSVSGKAIKGVPPVDLGKGVLAASLAKGSGAGSCVVTTESKVKCWGINIYGELGLGDSVDRGALPGQMGDRLPYVDLGAGVKVKALHHGFLGFCALLPADQLKCWGRVYNGRGFASPKMGDALKPIDLGGLHVKDVALGFDHACAIMSNGGLKCWGRNTYGQLGTEDVETRGDTPEDLGDNLPFIRLWD